MGLKPCLIEDFSNIIFDNKTNYLPDEEFEVYLWFNYNIDLDNEYPGDKIELINGKIVKKEDIQDILFDSWGLILKDFKDFFHSVIEMELV